MSLTVETWIVPNPSGNFRGPNIESFVIDTLRKQGIVAYKTKKKDGNLAVRGIEHCRGIPDLFYISDDGVVFVEVKANNDGLSLHQLRYAALSKYPVRVVWVVFSFDRRRKNSAENTARILKEWGIIDGVVGTSTRGL